MYQIETALLIFEFFCAVNWAFSRRLMGPHSGEITKTLISCELEAWALPRTELISYEPILARN